MTSSSLKTCALLLVAVNLVTSHPIEQSKVPDGAKPHQKGLGTGGGVGGYHGVFRHHNHGQSSGRGFDSSHDLPRKPVEGFNSQDQQDYVPSVGPKDSSYEQKPVYVYISGGEDAGPSPNNRPNRPLKPFVVHPGQEQPLSQDKDQGISGKPDSHDHNKPKIEIAKPASDLPTKYEPLNPEGPVYGGDKNPVQPEGSILSQDKSPLTPDGEVKPERPVYTKDKHPLSSVKPDRPVSFDYPIKYPNPEGPVHHDDKYPIKPEGGNKYPTKQDGGDKYPVKPEGSSHTKDDYPEKIPVNPEEPSNRGDELPIKPEGPSGVITEGPICVGEKCPITPEGPINSGDKYPVKPEGPSGVIPGGPICAGEKCPIYPEGPICAGEKCPILPEGPICAGEKCPIYPEGPINSGDKYPVNPEGSVNSGDKYPVNPEGSVNNGDKYPVNKEGPVNSGDKYPVKPEVSINSGDKYPVNPEGPLNIGEKYPVNPEGSLNSGEKYPVNPEGPLNSGEKYPVNPEGPVNSGDKYPVKPEGSINNGEKYPVNPEGPLNSGEKYPVNPEGPLNSGEKYPVNPEGPLNSGEKYPVNPEGPLNSGEKYPVNPEGPVNSGDKYPVNPEGPHNSGEKYPVNPEGPLNSGEKYPVNPEGPVTSGDKYPVKPIFNEDKDVINPIHTQEKAPLEPEDHIQRGDKFPTNTDGPAQRGDKHPLKPESHSHDSPTEKYPVKQDGNSRNPADEVQVQGNQEFIPNQPYGQEKPKDSDYKKPEQSKPDEEVPEKAFGIPGETRPIVPDEPTGPSGSLDPEKPFGPSDEGVVQKDTIPKELPAIRDLCQSLDLKRFLTLINRAEMGDIFSSKTPITIFAPSDAAFSRLPVHVYYRLTRDNVFLKQVLKYHIIEGVHPESGETDAKLEGVRFYQTQEPKMKIFFNSYEGNYYVNGLPITKASQRASNGMIHVIDNVLYPLPSKNIAETMQATSTFTRFYALAQEAGLFENELKDLSGPHTIFVPSDAAFAKLPRRTLEWLSFDKPALKTLLLKHIVPGAHFSSWVPETGISYTTMNPDVQIQFKQEKDHFTINGVRIGNHDIVAQDGVIHSVNEVLFTKDLQPNVEYRRPSLKRIYPSSPTSS